MLCDPVMSGSQTVSTKMLSLHVHHRMQTTPITKKAVLYLNNNCYHTILYILETTVYLEYWNINVSFCTISFLKQPKRICRQNILPVLFKPVKESVC